MVQTTTGGRTETAEWGIDNLYAKEFEFGSRSTVSIDKTTLLADNESTANIEVVVKNDFGQVVPSVPVTLSVPEDRVGTEVKGDAGWGRSTTVTSDSEGKAWFSVRGSRSGPLTLITTAEYPARWDPSLIQTMEKTIELTLVPVVSEANSSITVEPEGPIVADGTSKVEIKVLLKGTDPQEVISGREVELIDLPSYITVKDIAGNNTRKVQTDENGRAIFQLSSLGSWEGTVKVKVDRATEGKGELVLESPLLIFQGLIGSSIRVRLRYFSTFLLFVLVEKPL